MTRSNGGLCAKAVFVVAAAICSPLPPVGDRSLSRQALLGIGTDLLVCFHVGDRKEENGLSETKALSLVIDGDLTILQREDTPFPFGWLHAS